MMPYREESSNDAGSNASMGDSELLARIELDLAGVVVGAEKNDANWNGHGRWEHGDLDGKGKRRVEKWRDRCIGEVARGFEGEDDWFQSEVCESEGSVALGDVFIFAEYANVANMLIVKK